MTLFLCSLHPSIQHFFSSHLEPLVYAVPSNQPLPDAYSPCGITSYLLQYATQREAVNYITELTSIPEDEDAADDPDFCQAHEKTCTHLLMKGHLPRMNAGQHPMVMIVDHSWVLLLNGVIDHLPLS
jgi:hypothetical protein